VLSLSLCSLFITAPLFLSVALCGTECDTQCSSDSDLERGGQHHVCAVLALSPHIRYYALFHA
jgi:hypothetical protein